MDSCSKTLSLQAELERSLEEVREKAATAQDALSDKETELKELRSRKALEQGLVSKEDHEGQRLSLQAEINTLSTQLADLTRKHEKTSVEVHQYVCVHCDHFLILTAGFSESMHNLSRDLIK